MQHAFLRCFSGPGNGAEPDAELAAFVADVVTAVMRGLNPA